ncbi:MAG: winged helix-turn-helix domain-containing protein [Hyphomicrobiaceae bacterium]
MMGKAIRLGTFTLDMAQLRLLGPSGSIELRPKTFEVLRHLAENPGRVISKDELLEAVWPDVTVTDDVITHCISEARRAMGADGLTLIETVPRRGYMLVPPSAERTHRSDWDRGITKRSDLLPFARHHQLAVVATCSPSGMPQSSVVRFIVTDAFELIFTAHREHRKIANLQANPKVSAVIGWDEMQTLQLEGRGELLSGTARDVAMTIIADQAPDHYELRHRIEGLQYIKMTPSWMRYSDFRLNPASILTLDLDADTATRSARIYRAQPA